MTRAQWLVVRENRVLLLGLREGYEEYWLLPAGGIGEDNDRANAALGELKEERLIRGHLVDLLSYNKYRKRFQGYSQLVDMQDQEPRLSKDPELAPSTQILTDLRWLSLQEVFKRERCYLCAAGLMDIPAFQEELRSWSGNISYREKRPAR